MGTSTDLDEPAVRLLGPVELDGRPGALAPRERALLARLAIDAGRTVTVDRLVDDLWGDRPPASARNALQVYVSHLRGRLGRTILTSRAGGYRLELGPDRVDVLVFERLLAAAMGLTVAGRPAEAIDSLETAYALWRGAPLADLADYDFARIEAARLDELRATCLEQLAEALLAVGALDRLDRLAPLVRQFPFRERLRAAVMTGLYRQGRAVEALALYAEVVDQLREELGLEPGPALKALQRAILSDDPMLTAGQADTIPTGELTLLTTVLDGTAALEARLGDTYGDVVLVHRDLLRAAFAAHAGLTFPTDGERLLAAFATAADAVAAAVAAHRSLAAHAFPDDADVRVRIGIHTGRPRVVDQRYVGVDVHRVLQVAQAASGGQTLLTEPTAAQLDEQAGEQHRWHVTELGVHRLPDTARAEHLHQVAEAPESFPPPRTLGGRSNLPRTDVPLVGRAESLAALVEGAHRPGSGLTTLVGPGGSGKTRLAIEVADEIGRASSDAVYFVPLETADARPAVWAGLAAALGLGVGAAPAAVLAQLAGRRTLLVLDNLEQLGDVADLVEELLGVDGEVRVLATSRRPVGIPGERIHGVDPLADDAEREDASHLFALYAQLARPGFALDDDNRDAVRRICRRVDGLPLGIELAAARVRQLTPPVLAEMLDAGHDLVVGGPGRPERQRDLHALTDWSFRLLEPRQQRMLMLLSLFVGGVDLDTLARIPPDDGADPVTTTLELADASLVRIVENGSARAALLETVREHAAARLTASGRADAARDTHLGVHLDLARRVHPRVATRRQTTAAVHREGGNIEAALDRALERAEHGSARHADAAAEIVASLGEVWHQLGERALDRTRRAAAACPEGSPWRGWMTYWEFRRRWDTEVDDRLILELLSAAERQLRAAGEPEPLAALLAYGGNLGPDLGLGHDWGVARAREAVDLAEAADSEWLAGLTSAALARVLIEAGRWTDARMPLERARTAASGLADVDRLDALTMMEAELAALAGRREEAWLLAAPAAAGLVSGRSEGTLWSATSRLSCLAAHDRPAAAAQLVGVSLGALHRMGSTPGPADLLHLRASVRAAEDALGASEFDRLVEQGRAQSAEDAVAWVLDLLADPRAPGRRTPVG